MGVVCRDNRIKIIFGPTIAGQPATTRGILIGRLPFGVLSLMTWAWLQRHCLEAPDSDVFFHEYARCCELSASKKNQPSVLFVCHCLSLAIVSPAVSVSKLSPISLSLTVSSSRPLSLLLGPSIIRSFSRSFSSFRSLVSPCLIFSLAPSLNVFLCLVPIPSASCFVVNSLC